MENTNNITFADQDLIDQYPEIQAEFMREIFRLEPDDYLITDDSTLSDFATSSVELTNLLWGKMIVAKIEEKFGLKVEISWTLVQVFEAIHQSRQPVTLN